MAKDFLKKEIETGDTVVFTELGYRNFSTGIIEKITDKMVFIKCFDKNKLIKQAHSQVIKIDKL